MLEQLDISTLTPDPRNARRHTARNLAEIRRSLAAFGQQRPILVTRDNVVLAGNGTLAAARSLGWTTILALRTDLTGEKALAYAIADNRTAELAQWDRDVLAELLEELKSTDAAPATGFAPREIDRLIDDLRTDAAEDPLPNKYCVLIECKDEPEQRRLLARFTAEGITCRALVA